MHKGWVAAMLIVATAAAVMARGPSREERRRREQQRFEQAVPKVGDPAPEFELYDLDGREVKLADLRGRPVVIETGSYTCPVFRGKVKAMRELAERYGDRATILVLYTIEAHPKGSPSPYRPDRDEWVTPANERDGILIPQPETYEERLDVANRMNLKLDPERRVVVDGIDNEIWKAYGRRPNCGYVLDSELRIVAKQSWIEPRGIAAALDRLLGEADD